MSRMEYVVLSAHISNPSLDILPKPLNPMRAQQELTGRYKKELEAAEAAGGDADISPFPAQQLLAVMGAALQVRCTLKQPPCGKLVECWARKLHPSTLPASGCQLTCLRKCKCWRRLLEACDPRAILQLASGCRYHDLLTAGHPCHRAAVWPRTGGA